VEEALREGEHVRQLFVWGLSSMSAVVCVVVVPEHSSGLCDASDGEQRVLEGLRALAARAGLKAWEIPQRVLLERASWTEANGLLGAGGKLCRPALIRKYRAQLSGNASADDSHHDPTSAVYASTPVEDGGGLCAGLREVLVEVAPSAAQSTAAAFAANSSLVALGLDSIGIARLSSRLEEAFGVALSPRVLYSLPTLADLEAALFGGDAAVRRGAMRAAMINWRGEVDTAAQDLERDLVALCVERSDMLLRDTAAGPKDTVLLTGATGFLGAFLLRALASDTCSLGCARIVCVVRADNDGAAGARLRECMDGYGLSYSAERVTVLAGDLGCERLGLGTQAYFALEARLRCVVHCGARVSSAIPYSALRETNVGGTRRALALALLGGGTTDFVHVSTMGFLPLGHAETRDVSDGGLVAQSGYAQSKWVAEQLVTRAAAERGCRARVVRPGVVCGDSATGASNVKDATSMLLCGLVTEGIVCTDVRSPIPGLFNLCSVDYVAAAIVAIAALPFAQHEAQFGGAAFHLCARESIPLAAVCEWLQAAGYELREVAAPTFCARISKATEAHPLFAMKSLFAQPVATRPAPHAAEATAQQATRFSTEMADKAMEVAAAATTPVELLPARAMTERALGLAVANLLTRSGRADLVATPANGQGGRAGRGDISGFARP
jgi:thioester reductase-like protein